MVAYSRLCRRCGRAWHIPEIPSGVRCLGRDAYPVDPAVGAVINVNGVATRVLSAPVDVVVMPYGKDFSAIGPVKGDVGIALHNEVSVAHIRDLPMAL